MTVYMTVYWDDLKCMDLDFVLLSETKLSDAFVIELCMHENIGDNGESPRNQPHSPIWDQGSMACVPDGMLEMSSQLLSLY